MASCPINGNTIRKGMTALIDRDLMNTGLFDKNRDLYVAKRRYASTAQLAVDQLNDKFPEKVIKKLSSGRFSISISDGLVIQYVNSDPKGQALSTLKGMYFESAISPESWNQLEPFQALNYPEITEFTYNQLVTFLRSLNPAFRIEEVDNLSVDGMTSLKDFLIKVKNLAKFSAMPEEVAHVFIELLPDGNTVKQEMLNNITSFPVYSQTLAQYKDTYTLPDGRPDYDKIKREASAKLVGEYVTALATDNYTRVQELTKVKAGWLQRWFGRLLEWLGIGMRDHTRAYADIAGIILSGKNDMTLKTAKEVEDLSFTDSYFYRLSEQQLYDNAIDIANSRPPTLLDNISKFTKEFGRRFNEILKDEKSATPLFTELNEMLKRQGQDVTKINRLSEIQILLGEANIDLGASLDSVSFVTGVKEFLEAVDRLDILSSSILSVIKNKKDSENFDQAIKNIKELESYFGIYETFNNVISAELAQTLINAKVAPEIIESIQRTQLSFKNVNDHILSKLRSDLFVFYKGMISDSNNIAAINLTEDIARAQQIGSAAAEKLFKERAGKLIITDDEIIKMLSGKGRDIDNFSSLNHLINASHVNGDVYLSSMSRYVQNRIEVQQNKAQVVYRDLFQRVDPIQKTLNESAEITGAKITMIDRIFDRDTGEEREVLTWQNPHKGITIDIEAQRERLRQAAATRNTTDPNSEAFKTADANLKRVRKEYNNFLEKYMNRPFVKAYYDAQKKFENDTDFITAMTEWKSLSDSIRADETVLLYETDNIELFQELARKRRMRANLLNEYNEEGELKKDSELRQVRILKQYFEETGEFKEEDEIQTERSYMVARNRYEQKVDLAISQTRDANYRTIDEVEMSLQDLLKDSRLRVKTLYEASKDPQDPVDYGLMKDIIMEKWYKKNITYHRNEAFYKFEKELFDELEALQRSKVLTEEEEKIKEAYTAIRTILFGSRDELGQVNPASLSEEDKANISDLEDLIQELKFDIPRAGVNLDDFTPEDRQRYEDLGQVVKNEQLPYGRRRAAMRERGRFANKYKNIGKSKAISDLLAILGQITRKLPTNYYWDSMVPFIHYLSEFGTYSRNLNLPKEDNDEIAAFIKDFTETVDSEDWDRLDFVLYEREVWDAFLDWLRDNSTSHYNWFVNNHLQKMVFDPENGAYVKLKYARSVLYTYIEPTLDEHRKKVYNRRFRQQRVKDQYRTGYNPETKKVELQVGRHITNREYNGFPEFLPLLPEDGEPVDSPYRNQAYYDLRANDPVRFQYLEELKNAHLVEQERLPARLRTWMHVPVIGLTKIEQKTPSNLQNVAQEKWDYVKSIFKRNEAGDAQAQEEGTDTVQEIDQFTQKVITDRIPKLGMAQKLDVKYVSRNMLRAVGQMIFRAHEFEGRVEAEPVVKSLIRVMKDNEFKNQLSNKERAKKFESVYSQMILQEVPDTTLNNRAVRRLAKFITGNTAFRMLADPIGGVINYTSAMVNDVIEASAGKYLNLNELAKGKALAFRVNMNLMADYNKKANLSVDTLLFDTFDFIQGDFEEDLLDRASSKDKHASIRQMLMIPRKSGELMAQTAVAMGILERNKVLNSIDGKSYPVHQIYERLPGKNNLSLKKGFPEEWNPVDGEKFLKLKRLVNRVNFELHGNYAKISQSEASRYALGKLAENMKRWFMPAFQRRFGRETIDITFEDLNEGYYRTAGRAAQKFFGSLFRLDFGGAKDWFSVFLKTPRYRQNLSRMAAEIAQATLLFITFALLLGYSGGDKNKRLKDNSWIHNTAILIALRAYSETTAYIPVPPLGFQEMKRNALTPFSLPADAISNFAAIAQLGIYQVAYWMGWDSLRKNLYYSKDSGFWYSDKGDSKLFKYVLNTFGHSGYTINPDQYIRQFDNLQGRLK
jgi:hypothetical protein